MKTALLEARWKGNWLTSTCCGAIADYSLFNYSLFNFLFEMQTHTSKWVIQHLKKKKWDHKKCTQNPNSSSKSVNTVPQALQPQHLCFSQQHPLTEGRVLARCIPALLLPVQKGAHTPTIFFNISGSVHKILKHLLFIISPHFLGVNS